jgi:hypothetical protein
MTIPPDWLALNLANWNERVPIHLNAPASWDQLTALGRPGLVTRYAGLGADRCILLRPRCGGGL